MKKIVIIAILSLTSLAIQAASSSDKIQQVQEDITHIRAELARVNRERAELKKQVENQNWLQKMMPGGPSWMYGALENEVKQFEDDLKDAEHKLKELLAQQ